MWSLIKIKNFIQAIAIYLVLAFMIFLIGKVQTNIINSVLWTLTIVLLSFIMKRDSKPSTLNHLRRISLMIKIFSFIVLMLDIVVIAFLDKSKPAVIDPNSYDGMF